MKDPARFFFLTFVCLSLAFAEDKKIVSSWKSIKQQALSDRPGACQALKSAPWAAKFKHQDLIEFKLKEYCKVPPKTDVQNVSDLVALAQYHREQFNPTEAKQVLELAFQLSKTKSDKIQTLAERLRIDQILQDKSSRVQTLQRLSDLDPEKYTVDYARILWTYSKTKRAIQVLKTAEKKWPKNVSKQSVFYILGRIYEEKKNFKTAEIYYNKSLKQPPVDSDIFKNLLSTVAWSHFKKRKFKKSVELWEKLNLFATDRSTKTRAQFWTAKSLIKLKKLDQANQIFQQIIQEDPLSYYAALSHQETKEKFSPFPFQRPAQVTPLRKHSEVTEVFADKWTWALSFEENVFLESLIQPLVLSFYRQSAKDQMILFENLWSANLTNLMTQILAQAPLEVRADAYQRFTPFLFPRPFEELILPEAQAHSLEPSLVYSLIRQESGFNPAARSPTDALGLMQVMPKVAFQIASRNQIALKEKAELFQPALNIKIGTLELKNRVLEFQNNYVLAVASYNAGTDPVHGWVKSRKRKDVIEFIEEIPYEETRNYVRLILRNQIIYRRLAASEKFDFPVEWLKPISK